MRESARSPVLSLFYYCLDRVAGALYRQIASWQFASTSQRAMAKPSLCEGHWLK